MACARYSRDITALLSLERLEDVLSVLIVAGDMELRGSIAGALGEDCIVTGVSSLSAARQVLDLQRVDVVLLDLETSEGEALALIGRMAAMKHRPCIIVLSLAGQVAKAVKAMRLGANDYLAKPCDPDTVKRAIRECVERGSTLGANA